MIAETAQPFHAAAKVETGSMRWSRDEFEAVFLEHYARVAGVLMRLLGDRSRAEELANDVFWKLYHISRLGELDGRVGGWLYRTASNLGIDALRAAARRRKYEEEAARSHQGTATTPLDDLMRAEQGRRVRAILAALKPAQAQLLILRASGLSYKELGEALEVNPAGIGTMLSRAQAEFRRIYLQRHGAEEEL